jgi:hypothetical protein
MTKEAKADMPEGPKAAAFVFVGDPNDNWSGPDVIEVHGHTFTRGEPTEVADAKIAEKFAKHTHFVAADEYEAPKPKGKGK